jgi:hypothetical protein
LDCLPKLNNKRVVNWTFVWTYLCSDRYKLLKKGTDPFTANNWAWHSYFVWFFNCTSFKKTAWKFMLIFTA